jgi:hypothetical protein
VSTTTTTVSTAAAAAVESAATTTSAEAATTTAHASTVEAAAYVPTAVEPTAYVATAAEPTRCATCEAVSTTCIAGSAVVKGIASAGVANSTPVTSTTTVAVARSTVVSTAAIVAAATVVSAAAPVPAIPRASSDEETTDKPARPVVAVGRACVRIIVVIPPRADRGGVPVAVITVSTVSTVIANPDTYTYLGTRRSRHKRCGNHQRAEQQEISENLHFGPPRQGIMHCVTNRFGDTSTTLVNFGCYYLKQHFLIKVAPF